MKKILLVACFFLSMLSLYAGSNKDSLWAVWNNKALSDTSRMNAFHHLIYNHYCMSNPDSGIILSETLLKFALEKNSKRYEAIAHNLIGFANVHRGDYENNLEQNKIALQIAESINDSLAIGMALSDMGISYNYFADYITANQCFQRALKINRALGNTLYEGFNLANLGVMYFSMNNIDKAEEYYKASLKLNEKSGDKQTLASNTGNLGLIYMQQNNMALALQYFELGLKMSLEGGFKLIAAYYYGNMAYCYVTLKEYARASECNAKMKAMADELNSEGLFAFYYSTECKINHGLGKYNQAIEACEKGEQFAIKASDLDSHVTITLSLYEIHKVLQNGSKALEYHEKLSILQDSLAGNKAKTDIQRVEFNEQLLSDSLKQIERDKLTALEMRKQKVIRNSITGGLVAALVFSLIIYLQRNKTRKEKKRSDELLRNILPDETAEELKSTGEAQAKHFDEVTVLFTDFKNFTQISEKLSATELVKVIHFCYSEFDKIISNHNLEKIKTIGDSYMCAGGLPVANTTHAFDAVSAALEMRDFINEEKQKRDSEGSPFFEIRIGCHTGPVVAGIVGIKKFAYDIWGDTVNIAARMESSGEAGKVNISGATYEQVKDNFRCGYRGKIEAKNKGVIDMYFVETIS